MGFPPFHEPVPLILGTASSSVLCCLYNRRLDVANQHLLSLTEGNLIYSKINKKKNNSLLKKQKAT